MSDTIRSSKARATKLLKCFCGCSELTEDEVQRIYQASPQATLIDQKAVNLLRNFLKQQRCGDKSEAEQNLDVYLQCEKFMQQEEVLTLDELDELCDLGMNYYLEKELKTQIQTGDNSNIQRCLMRIQGECRNEIEASAEYKRYKDALLKKLHQRI